MRCSQIICSGLSRNIWKKVFSSKPRLPLFHLLTTSLIRKNIKGACESFRMEKHNVNVFLINTGWTGGMYGVGKRMNLPYTRAMVSAALNGELDNVPCENDDIFGMQVPTSCPDVPREILIPRNV